MKARLGDSAPCPSILIIILIGGQIMEKKTISKICKVITAVALLVIVIVLFVVR